jgi:hypothetical protein
MSKGSKRTGYKLYTCSICKKQISEFANWACENEPPICETCKDIPPKEQQNG